VNLTSPANGTAFLAPASIAMTANATDSDGTVTLLEFLQNGVVVGTTNVVPYTLTWSNVAAGSYSLAARATDNRSGVTTSAPVNVIVTPPNSPPTVALTSPMGGAAYLAPAAIALTATASDNDGTIAKVDFFAGPTLIGTAPTTSPSTGAAWRLARTLTARATDNLGASTTSSAVAVTVNANQPPTASLVAPAPGATYQRQQRSA
jgi:chitinase